MNDSRAIININKGVNNYDMLNIIIVKEGGDDDGSDIWLDDTTL